MTHWRPNYSYVEEKWSTLMKYCFRPGGLTQGDFEELKMLMQEPWYKPKRDDYMRNLSVLKQETERVFMDPKRKRVMLASLEMIEGLIAWFEGLNPNNLPRSQLEKLTDAIANYFPQFWMD
jgi:hypothetical protein